MMEKICPRCQREFETKISHQQFCTKCRRLRSSREFEPFEVRPFTNDTPFLCYKWHSEGMNIRNISAILRRPESQVREAIALYEEPKKNRKVQQDYDKDHFSPFVKRENHD